MPKFTVAADWAGAKASTYDKFKYADELNSDDDPEDDIADDNFVFDNETKMGIKKGHKWKKSDREQDDLEKAANDWLAEMEKKQAEMESRQVQEARTTSWGHGGSHNRSHDPRKAEARAQRRKTFADKLKNFTQRALVQDAKLIVGAMKRNVKTLARARHPFANYVTQRRDSNWKKSFSYEKHTNKVRIGVNKTKNSPLSFIFERGGYIYWCFAYLFRDRTKAERRAIFKKFLEHSPTWKSRIKKIPRIGDLKLDMTDSPVQPYLKVLRKTMSPLKLKLADEEHRKFWYAKHRKYVHYPFVSKSAYEVSGLLSVPPRKLLTHLKTKGQDSIWHKGLLDMTQKELEAFCREQNRLNKRRRNVKRNSIPNLRPEQLAGILKRVSWRNR